jgi:hypothetical protein
MLQSAGRDAELGELARRGGGLESFRLFEE